MIVQPLLRGLVAGMAGTAALTACQLAVRKARGESVRTPVPDRWSEAPAPARVAKKTARTLGVGGWIRKRHTPWLTNVVHWLYGTTWGVVYGVAAERLHPDPLVAGATFGTGVWSAAYAELVPLGISEPPWKQPPKELALDYSYHLVYGLAVAGAYAALDH